jgi:hypothetical protein
MRWMKCSTKPAKRDSLRRAAICILPLVLLISAAAQESTLRSPSNLVVVPPPVKGREGGIANGRSAKDFVIEDVGVEPPVRLDEAPEQQPISLVIAIPTGRRASYEFSRIQRLNSMLEPIVDAGFAQVGFVEFDSPVHAVHPFIGNAHQVSQDLQELRPGDGGAAIRDAADYSVKMREKPPRKGKRIKGRCSRSQDACWPRPRFPGTELQARIITTPLLWLQVICQLFTVSLLLNRGEFS